MLDYKAYVSRIDMILDVASIDLKHDEVELYDKKHESIGDFVFDIDEVEIMPYTGRKDERNRKVYKGDIVRCKDLHDTSRPPFTGYVDFRDCSFVIKDGLMTNYRWMDYEIIVIGNMYTSRKMMNSILGED